MIDISIKREDNAVRSILATGHATKGRKAEQICSGVSTLMYTFALSLQDIKRVGINVVDDDVGMCVQILRGHTRKDVQIITDTVLRGLRGIAELYPHSVRIRSH